MESLKRAAKRAADLLNTEEMSGWRLAKLTAERTLTSSAPKKVKQERDEGRVSSAEWAQAVSEAWGRSWAEGTAQVYARCWRRYGETRLAADGCERPFYEHMYAAETSEQNADARIAKQVGRGHGVAAPPTPAQVVEAIRNDPDVARAIARHDDTREAVEEHGIQARAEKKIDIDKEYQRRRKQVDDAAAAMARRMGTDLALGELRQAVDCLGAAIVMKEEYGVENTEEEAELVEKARRLIAAYDSGKLSTADEQWLETLGIGS